MQKDNRFDPPEQAKKSPHARGKANGKPAHFSHAASAAAVANRLVGSIADDATIASLNPDWHKAYLAAEKGTRELTRWRDNQAKRRKNDPADLGEMMAALDAAIVDASGSVGFVGSGGEHSRNTDGGSVGFVGDAPDLIPQFEGPPKPVDAELLDVPPLDLAWLPGPFRALAQDIAERGSFPIEYPSVAIMVVLSSLVAGRLAVCPKQSDEWMVIANLWGVLVGKAGMAKSPSIADPLSMLKRLARRAASRFEDVSKQASVEATVKEARKKAAIKALDKAASERKCDEELRLLAADIVEEVTLPTLRRYEVNDTSVEKLGEILRDNPLCPLLFRDELDGLFASFNKEGHESDRKFYLETWAGDSSYTFDRIGRGTTFVKSMRLAVLGTIQPGPLAKHLKAAVAGTQADGFMNRFQLMVYPDTPRYIHVDRRPDAAALAEAYRIIEWLDDYDPGNQGAEFNEGKEIHFLHYSDLAQPVADEWHTDNQNRCRSSTETSIMQSHLSKFSSLMPSLALIHHVVESSGDSNVDPISLESTRIAIEWCKFFESHARRVYQSVSDGDPAIAASLSGRLKKLPNPFTPREVAIKGWAGLGTVEDVVKALGILEDRNHVKSEEVRAEKGSAGGRTSLRFWVHPSILKGEAVS